MRVISLSGAIQILPNGVAGGSKLGAGLRKIRSLLSEIAFQNEVLNTSTGRDGHAVQHYFSQSFGRRAVSRFHDPENPSRWISRFDKILGRV